MKVNGTLDLMDNQAQHMSLELETEFPASPVAGRVTFKDKRVWICIAIGGSPLWVPLGPSHDTYIHTQTTASAMWEIEHNFNTTTPTLDTPIYPIVQFYDGNGDQFIPQAVYYVDDSKVYADMGHSVTGKAVCMYGDSNYYEGLITPQYAYNYEQTTPSSTWVIRHWLGYTPVVRVFDTDGAEIQPLSIVADDAFQVTIRFSVNTVGTARMI